MTDDNRKIWKEGVEHPSEDDLLCYIDGELQPRHADGVRSHLEACWHCRNRAEKFQTAISLFVDYRGQVLRPAVEVPNNWGGFQQKLQQNVADAVPPTFWERWRASITRLRSKLPDFEPRIARLATISVATLLLISVGLYFLVQVPTVVSAEELINLAVASREAELKKAEQPVLYQQLRVTRKVAGREEAANVELWQDVDNLRMRKVVTPLSEPGTGGVQVATGSAAEPLADLEQILRANRYEPPALSIVGFRAWRNTLVNKTDLVEETNLSGIPALRLRTETTTKIDPNQLIASVLTVRAADYHPLEQVFRFLNSNGEINEYEVRESSFAVMSLNSLNPGFFADSEPIIASVRPGTPVLSLPPAVAGGSPEADSNVAVPETAPNTVATAELEVEVMNALHAAGADLGEQIEVRRAPNGPVTISGVVETPERKAQIINALNNLKDNPAVRIQISTVSEAIAAEKTNRARPQPSVERLQVDADSYPAEGDLLAHFGDANKARNFAARMTGQSSRAMNYLWAMKRLKGQFGTAQVAKLTPEARTKLLSVMRSYAASYQREIATLRRDLSGVFGGGGGGQAERIDSDTELLQTIDQLFAAGSGANQVVRTAFLTSASGTNALKTAQFWQQLSRAESLAASIEKYR